MAGNVPDWHLFGNNSFPLTASTLQRFIKYHSTYDFDGKFVFNKKNNKLILARGEETLHLALARESDPNYQKQDIVAAFINFRNIDGVLIFELDDNSTEFGNPSAADFRQAASYIKALLEGIHYSPTIIEYPDEPKVIIEDRLI